MAVADSVGGTRARMAPLPRRSRARRGASCSHSSVDAGERSSSGLDETMTPLRLLAPRRREIDLEVGVAEGEGVVGRRELRKVEAPLVVPVGVDAEIVAVGEHDVRAPCSLSSCEPAREHPGIDLAEAAPAARGDAAEELAEDELGVGRADRLERRPGDDLEALREAPAWREEPVAARRRLERRAACSRR